MSAQNKSLGAAYEIHRKNFKKDSKGAASKLAKPMSILEDDEIGSVADAILAKKRKALDPIDEQEMDLGESFEEMNEEAALDEAELEAEEAPKDESVVDAILRKRSKKLL